ncbi:MAG TPA: signal peptidase I [Streptosporangiaceae bacterium]|nr:signal peptidase I [Streptosporangiaceae bacterium]
MANPIYVGNAAADAPQDRGWLIGHFKPAGDPRHTGDVEVKWAIHPAGDQRPQWVAAEQRSTLLLLISGRFRLELPDRSVLLAEHGDYVLFHRLGHCWHAEQASVVLTVRWPSVPGYALPDPEQQPPIRPWLPPDC